MICKLPLLRYNILLLAASLFLNAGCSSGSRPETLAAGAGSAFLQQTLAYHDPEGKWQQFNARLYLSSADTTGKVNTFEIEMDNSTGYFAHISRSDGQELVKGMQGGKPFYRLNGDSAISAADRVKYGLNPEGVKWVHRFYGYLYGLPMKLTDASAKAEDAKTTELLGGKPYQVLQVKYDPGVGKDNWFFYLDPATFALRAYRFNHGQPESGEYILLEGEETVAGIRIPKVRKWYLNKNQKYLGTDTLLKGELLASPKVKL